MPPPEFTISKLLNEGRRQLSICNSCRYCEGYCPVWPALELRRSISDGDVTYLANLCHDCQDCYTACMYSPPHEFAVNPPQIFAQVRSATYDQYVWPRRRPGRLRGRTAILLTAAPVTALLLVLRFTLAPTAGPGSPYGQVPHWLLVTLAMIPVAWGAGVLCEAALRYWRDIGGRLPDLARPVVWLKTLADGARLRHMNGGGAGCDYPDERPANMRRYSHVLLVAGLMLCFASTVAASAEQEVLGNLPPYPLDSAPVLLGMAGGAGMLAGCIGLLRLQRRRNPGLTTPRMSAADRWLVWFLLLLAATGILATATRTTPAFAPVVLAHIGLVLTCFVVAPYTKFSHFVYRLLSIYKNRLEQSAAP